MKKLTEHQKKARNYRYYKDKVKDFVLVVDQYFFKGSDTLPSEYKKMQVNFDLFNNKINLKDLAYVCKPFGSNIGQLPAKMTNKDISSGKIKVFLGMESKKPFFFNFVAVNPEATTRKEQKEAKLMEEYVVSYIMSPIRQKLELEAAQQIEGRELTEEEQQQIRQAVEQELKAKTPSEVKKYMEREHQDPAEILYQHISNYLIQDLDLKRKFEEGLKYMALSAKQIYYVGILNSQYVSWTVNPMNFRVQLSERSPFIEDGEAAACDYYMSITDVQEFFGDELSETELNKIYKDINDKITSTHYGWFLDHDLDAKKGVIRVTHHVWKDLRDVQILYYFDEDGETQKKIVNSDYVFNPDNGDISIEKEWMKETYQCWKIGADIYKKMGPINNQIKDRDRIHISKLPYYGAVCDNMNSEPTSLMDRLAPLQHYFNIIMYRLELLMASDKGKKVLAHIGTIPNSKNFSLEKFHYLFETSPMAYVNLDQEGSTHNDINTSFKTIDLSLASDIAKYVELASFIKRFAGESIGIPEPVEGQIGPDEAVNNVKQSMIQNLHILEPYYKLHNQVKRNYLEACVKTAIICWQKTKPNKLSYILDDMTKVYFDVDLEILNNNIVGIFISDNTKTEEIKDTIRQLTHAAMQNNKVELSQVLSVLRDESLITIEETLKVAEKEKAEEMQNLEQMKGEQQEKLLKMQEDMAQKQHERNLEEIVVKESERRKTELAKNALLGASFNPDADSNKDGKNDFVELANSYAERKQKDKELQIKEKEVDNKEEQNKRENKLKEKELKNKNK